MKWGKPEWAAIPLRLILGIILLVAGYFKLTQMTNTIAFFTKYGFPVPVATAWFIASLEFLGGAALIVGLFVRYLGILYTIEFIVAVLMGSAANPRLCSNAPSLHVHRRRVGTILSGRRSMVD
jgi:uncharacterized membrane protein YphA (DoxX/SURF4 family)